MTAAVFVAVAVVLMAAVVANGGPTGSLEETPWLCCIVVVGALQVPEPECRHYCSVRRHRGGRWYYCYCYLDRFPSAGQDDIVGIAAVVVATVVVVVAAAGVAVAREDSWKQVARRMRQRWPPRQHPK